MESRGILSSFLVGQALSWREHMQDPTGRHLSSAITFLVQTKILEAEFSKIRKMRFWKKRKKER